MLHIVLLTHMYDYAQMKIIVYMWNLQQLETTPAYDIHVETLLQLIS